MLYSIIPPILVVLSLAGIIIFLAKKAPQIAGLDDEDDLEMEQARAMASAGFFRRIGLNVKNIGWAGVGQVFLGAFEGLTRGAKMMFTSLESQSKNLSESIKSKRVVRKNRRLGFRGVGIENNEDADIINKIEQYHQNKEDVLKEEVRTQKEEIAKEEKIIRPTVSTRVVRPKSRVEMKDRLEDLLIERIAANPKDVEAYERLGEYYMEIDSLMDAKECFKQVLKLDSKNENVKYRMKRLEAMLHRR